MRNHIMEFISSFRSKFQKKKKTVHKMSVNWYAFFISFFTADGKNPI